MSKNCYIIFNDDGYLICTVNHRKPHLCDLYKEDNESEYIEEFNKIIDRIIPTIEHTKEKL